MKFETKILSFAVTKSTVGTGGNFGRKLYKTRRNRRNTERNTQKQNGERQEMVWKLGKHIIEGITITITQKTI